MKHVATTSDSGADPLASVLTELQPWNTCADPVLTSLAVSLFESVTVFKLEST